MLRMTTCVLALTAGFLIAIASPAAAAPQLTASRPPRTTGPLEPAEKSCTMQSLRGDGRTYVRSEACVFVFDFERLKEMDPLRAYGVAWLQFTLDAQQGLCADRLEVALDFPDNTVIEDFAPGEPLPAKQGRRAEVHLDVSAGGTALENGSVSQHLIVHPARLEGRGDATSFIAAWRGHTAAKIALVGGAEVSWFEIDPLDSIELRIHDIEIVAC